jgi:hypothetical protein
VLGDGVRLGIQSDGGTSIDVVVSKDGGVGELVTSDDVLSGEDGGAELVLELQVGDPSIKIQRAIQRT